MLNKGTLFSCTLSLLLAQSQSCFEGVRQYIEILAELYYEVFEEFYLNSTDHTLNKHERKFIMPDRLTRINFKKTQQQKLNKVPMFSIHTSTMERVIFNEVWSGRKMFEFPYSIPLNSAY